MMSTVRMGENPVRTCGERRVAALPDRVLRGPAYREQRTAVIEWKQRLLAAELDPASPSTIFAEKTGLRHRLNRITS
jgi:hypothetical protein